MTLVVFSVMDIHEGLFKNIIGRNVRVRNCVMALTGTGPWVQEHKYRCSPRDRQVCVVILV